MRYSINKGVIVQKMGNKTVIFDGEASVLYTFNETASFIFQKLKLGWELAEIEAAMVKRYGISPEKARADLSALLGDLSAKKIVLPASRTTTRPNK